MRSLEIAAGSDAGRTRARNEDAYYAGEGIFAVADGMGGHLAGDVASATALLPIESLDGRVFPDAATAQAAILDAILAANAAVVRKAANEPNLHGMGTTLTACVVEGRRLHVAHVGDSRAYLVRDGHLVQLTRDHTLVAHLIAEGQITEEEAAVHPQRSIITRAIGVDVELDVDTMTIDLVDGDQVMLCSDGLTGPVDDQDILDVLTNVEPAGAAVEGLIELANEHGGPDNITVVLLRYLDDEPSRGNGRQPTVIRPDAEDRSGDSDWARDVARFGALGRARDEYDEDEVEEVRSPRRWQRVVGSLVVLLVLLATAAAGGRWLLSRSYFVGLEGDRVAIYRGVPVELGPVELSWVAETTTLHVDEVAEFYVDKLEEGVAAADLADARRIVEAAPRSTEEDEEPDASASPGPSPTASATGP